MKTRRDFKRTAKPNMAMQHSREFVLETHISNAKLTSSLSERRRETSENKGRKKTTTGKSVNVHFFWCSFAWKLKGCEAQGNWDFLSLWRAWKIWFWPMSHLMHRCQIWGLCRFLPISLAFICLSCWAGPRRMTSRNWLISHPYIVLPVLFSKLIVLRCW